MMKMTKRVGVSLFVFWGCVSGAAFACSPVAKVIYYTKADIKLVTITRTDDSASSKIQDDLLCSGDIVKVAKDGRVTVKYMTKDLLETELRGVAELPIYSIKTTTKLANLRGVVADLGKWFRHDDADVTARMMTRTGLESGKSVIRSPLVRGEGAEYPFMLRSDLKKLHFFWRGGMAPWQVAILREDGRKIITQDVSQPTVVLPLSGITATEVYSLWVSSSDGKTFQKKLVFKDQEATESATAPLQVVVNLLYLDAEDNWRLQLWSYLQDQGTSSIKSTVLDHLEKDDL